jgi:hypothetical protein
MKKVLFGLLILSMLICVNADAGKIRVTPTVLSDTTNGNWTNLAMTTATGTYTSSGIDVRNSNGFASLLVLTSAGSLDIDFQVSDDNVNWYTPVDTSLNTLGSVNGAVTSDRWIVFSPQAATWIRFIFILTGSNSTVSATVRSVITTDN